MTRRTSRFGNHGGPGAKTILREVAFAVLLGVGLGFIFNDMIWGLILGAIYGLTNCFDQTGAQR